MKCVRLQQLPKLVQPDVCKKHAQQRATVKSKMQVQRINVKCGVTIVLRTYAASEDEQHTRVMSSRDRV